MATAAQFLLLFSFLLVFAPLTSNAHSSWSSISGQWRSGHATYYGGPDASGTNGGSCGFEDVKKAGYGLHTAALSAVLYKDGEACGSCYEVKCDNSKWCKGHRSVIVTATNLCPAGDERCSPPHEHFDLSQPAFLEIAEEAGGVVPIKHRRVPCKKQGGVRFSISGNPYFNLVSILNVGGAGGVKNVEVKPKGSNNWIKLKRNWGTKWETDVKLVGQKLTFRITTMDGRTLTSSGVLPENWQFGQSYEGINF